MAVVLGLEIPVLEFLLILNVIMLFYVVISMFEIRNLVKLKKDLEILIEEIKKLLPNETKNKQENIKSTKKPGKAVKI